MIEKSARAGRRRTAPGPLKRGSRSRGFSLVELMVAISIGAVLGAVRVSGYQEYFTRAQATDLIAQQHELHSALSARAQTGSVADCAQVAAAYPLTPLAGTPPTLGIG